MRRHVRTPSVRLILVSLTLILLTATAFARVPGEHWRMYANPEDAGFSTAKLAEARAYWESIDSAAAFLVYDGAVVVAWGDYERRFLLHSARKSVMSGVYGIHVDAGNIDTEKTLAELGIDDENFSLNDTEKGARIIDLLRARSGVYHFAAAEPRQNPKPERGAYPPGEHWCYNNWDFNALCTIIEQELGIRFFDEVDKRFAKPLRMEDYHPRHGIYQFEPDMSIHPAYHIRMSARDMARYGLLYLEEGKWGGKRILSKQWVADSSYPFSDDAWGDGYGYMWWVSFREGLRELGMYSALGVGNQSIDVIPGADMVFINRTNTFIGNRVTNDERCRLIELLVDARTGKAKRRPRLIDLPVIEREREVVELSLERKRDILEADTGTDRWSIVLQGEDLVYRNGEETMDLIALADNGLLIDDTFEMLYIENSDDGAGLNIISEDLLNGRGYGLLEEGHPDEAIAMFRRALAYYPEATNVWDSLADAYLAKQEYDRAIGCFEKILTIDPGDRRAASRIAEVELWRNPVIVDESVLATYVGEYEDLRIDLEDDGLHATHIPSGQSFGTMARSEIEFIIVGVGFSARFEKGDDGIVRNITLVFPDGREQVQQRTAD
ncbi:MAG: serine hydrolase [bacterium]|nr:serine hydrolase [bacterium]